MSLGGAKGEANKRVLDERNKDAKEFGAFGSSKTQRVRAGRGQIKADGGGSKGSEWGRGDVDVREVDSIDNIGKTRLETVEETGIRRFIRIRQVVHTLVEGKMLGVLDCFSFNVKVDNVLHGIGITEEDTFTGIIDSLGRSVRAGRDSIDTAAEGAKETEVRAFSIEADGKG